MPFLFYPLAVLAASEGAASSFDLQAIMSGAVDSVKADILGVLGIVIPAAVVILGAVVAWNFGRKWLKKLAN